MDSLVLYYPDDHQKHFLPGHPERPDRVEVIREGLQEGGFWHTHPIIEPFTPSQELLTSVHDVDYIRLLERTSQRGQMLDPDTYTTRDSWRLACNAAGGALAVVDRVWEGAAAAGFALTRPPGHHATQSRAMGFCLINNVAVAAQYLLGEKGAQKIAILDLDLHHGNGTQDIFWDRDDVVYISVHQAPFYPGTGYLSEIGVGPGEGATLNLPIPAFSGDVAYHTLLGEIILPYLDQMKPDLVLISYGFDTHWLDPLGSMQVSAGCMYRMIAALKEWADSHNQGKIVVILEGGYDLEAGKACGQAVAAGLLKDSWDDRLGRSSIAEQDNWMATFYKAKELLGF
jgi:acetoin utilization deacetylase AcuC-like enzyme